MFGPGVLMGVVGSFLGIVAMLILSGIADSAFEWSEAATGWLVTGLLVLIAVGILIFGRPIDRQYKLSGFRFPAGACG